MSKTEWERRAERMRSRAKRDPDPVPPRIMMVIKSAALRHSCQVGSILDSSDRLAATVAARAQVIHDLRPASDSKIARWLGMNPTSVRRVRIMAEQALAAKPVQFPDVSGEWAI